MSAQRGKDLLLKIGDALIPDSYTTIGGLRAKSFSLNAQSVDSTHGQSADGWRELLAGAGVRSASITGSGVFLSDSAANEVRDAFFNGEIRNWEVIVPGFGAIAGAFQLSNLDYAGDYDSEATMSLALESAGALEFTPETP